MPLHDPISNDGMIEECLDAMNDFVATLDRYPPTTIAVAMSVHLQSLLSALLECDLCTPLQVREFVEELGREVLAESDSCPAGEDSTGCAESASRGTPPRPSGSESLEFTSFGPDENPPGRRPKTRK